MIAQSHCYIIINYISSNATTLGNNVSCTDDGKTVLMVALVTNLKSLFRTKRYKRQHTTHFYCVQRSIQHACFPIVQVTSCLKLWNIMVSSIPSVISLQKHQPFRFNSLIQILTEENFGNHNNTQYY